MWLSWMVFTKALIKLGSFTYAVLNCLNAILGPHSGWWILWHQWALGHCLVVKCLHNAVIFILHHNEPTQCPQCLVMAQVTARLVYGPITTLQLLSTAYNAPLIFLQYKRLRMLAEYADVHLIEASQWERKQAFREWRVLHLKLLQCLRFCL